MRCPNCRCEIGTLEVCPYCGVRLRNPTRPVPRQEPRPTPSVYRAERSNARTNRHISNIDTWSLLTVVLLGGIFVVELLQLIVMAWQ